MRFTIVFPHFGKGQKTLFPLLRNVLSKRYKHVVIIEKSGILENTWQTEAGEDILKKMNDWQGCVFAEKRKYFIDYFLLHFESAGR